MKNKRVSIKGEIVGEITQKISNGGVPYCKFGIRCKEGLFEAIGFNEKANITDLRAGAIVSVRGSYRDTEALESKTITIDAIVVDGEKRSVMVEEFGTIEKYQIYLKETSDKRLREGMVRAFYMKENKDGVWGKRGSWFAEDRCTKHPLSGELWLSIELCMNVLGPENVTARLKNGGVSIAPGDHQNNRRYEKVLAQMLSEVNDILREEAPF